MSINDIPPITDPMGRHWKQPDRSEILVDEEHALMSEDTFKRLPDYSCSKPSGVYPGKMWKAHVPEVNDDAEIIGWAWYLRWYGADDGDPRGLVTPHREILIV